MCSTTRCSLLALRGRRTGHSDDDVGEAPVRGFVRDEQRGQALGPGLPQAEQHVRRPAAGGDADRQVPWPAERLHLPAEHVLVAVVVGDSGDGRGVGGQREAGQPGALAAEPADQLRHQVLRVARAAAVAEGEHGAARGEAGRQQPAGREQIGGQPAAGQLGRRGGEPEPQVDRGDRRERGHAGGSTRLGPGRWRGLVRARGAGVEQHAFPSPIRSRP